MMSRALPLFVFANLLAHSACRGEDAAPRVSAKPAQTMKIQIRLGEKKLTATLRHTAATREFLSLLPLREKLPRRCCRIADTDGVVVSSSQAASA